MEIFAVGKKIRSNNKVKQKSVILQPCGNLVSFSYCLQFYCAVKTLSLQYIKYKPIYLLVIDKNRPTSTTATSISEYIGYCKDACLIFDLENFASKFAERATVKKYYFIDNGLLNIFLTDNETSLIENICAITLYRESIFENGDGRDLYYYNKECELDFYIPSRKKGIQVAYSINDPVTRDREINGLTTFHKLYGLEKAEIVTYSESGIIETENLSIRVVPLSQWLLEQESH